MKKILILIAILTLLSAFFAPVVLNAEEVAVDVNGKEYILIIPEDLKEGYIRAMTAYIGESLDYEKLDASYKEYRESAENTIAVKDGVIETQQALIDVKDQKIKELKRGTFFSIIPHVNYARGENENQFGIGAGVLLFNSFYADVSAMYPWEISFAVGWKF